MNELIGIRYLRIPKELKDLDQWCVSGTDKAPLAYIDGDLKYTSSVEGPWMSFKQACQIAHNCPGVDIGFVITPNDPYTCIDLDVKDSESIDKRTGSKFPVEKWTCKKELDFYCGVIQYAESYAELSQSGKGLHIWVKGDIGAGRRKDGVEIYSRERYVICTGESVGQLHYSIVNNVVKPVITSSATRPIVDGRQILYALLSRVKTPGVDKSAIGADFELVELDPTEADEVIWSKATKANNSKKFIDLCAGEWGKYNYPSQSEADSALMTMLAFYSKSNSQCRRLFRQTELGKRTKAVKDDKYLNFTLKGIRARESEESERKARMETHGEEQAAAILKVYREKTQGEDGEPTQSVRDYVSTLDQSAISSIGLPEPPTVAGLDWPPGVLGALAGYIYEAASPPVKEIAIATALGLMAGVTGKAYNTPGSPTGLNLYLTLLARSGTGKEAIHSCINKILKDKVCGKALEPFVSSDEFVSGPALTKGVLDNQSFVSLWTEWGQTLRRIGEDRDLNARALSKVLLQLYSKSGPTDIIGGMRYSKHEDSVRGDRGAAYSLIGDSTAGTFYKALSDRMAEDGFFSRLTIIEYKGEVKPFNKSPKSQMPPKLATILNGIGTSAKSRLDGKRYTQVKWTEGAELLLDEYCDDKRTAVNRLETDDDPLHAINIRAHLKALRVASILAVCDNPVDPIINADHASWAIYFIEQVNRDVISRVKGGDVGDGDDVRCDKLTAIIKDYLVKKVPRKYKTGLFKKMLEIGVIPRDYLTMRTCSITCFKTHRLGAKMALDVTIKGLLDDGILMELDRGDVFDNFEYRGRAFRYLGE